MFNLETQYIPLSMKGKVIFVEGGDFTGKTTLCKMFVDALNSNGFKAYYFRQPGSTPLGEDIRDVLFKKGHDGMNQIAERMLFSADHAEFVQHIKKMQREDPEAIIICDRYNPISNIVYGHFGNDLSCEVIRELNKIASQKWYPDLIVILEVDEETMFKRIAMRAGSEETNRIDLKGIEFKRKIAEGYRVISRYIAEFESKRLVYMNSEGSPEAVLKEFCNLLKNIYFN